MVTFIRIQTNLSNLCIKCILGLTGEVQGCNGIGGKAYVKSSILRPQTLTSSGIKLGCCFLKELGKANLWRLNLASFTFIRE